MRVKRVAFAWTGRRSRADALGRGGAGGGLGRREGDEERDERGGHDVPGGSGEIVGRLDEPGGDERSGAAEEGEGEGGRGGSRGRCPCSGDAWEGDGSGGLGWARC